MNRTGHTSKRKGFARAATLMERDIRKASEDRGFAVSRLLTHWAEVVGPDIAGAATPVNVTYGKGGMAATLTLLTSGAQAPMIEMQKMQICDKVNACYGYRAISRIRVTQTAPTGFAEGKVVFTPAPSAKKTIDPAMQSAASSLCKSVDNTDLRAALTALGANVFARHGKSNQR